MCGHYAICNGLPTPNQLLKIIEGTPSPLDVLIVFLRTCMASSNATWSIGVGISSDSSVRLFLRRGSNVCTVWGNLKNRNSLNQIIKWSSRIIGEQLHNLTSPYTRQVEWITGWIPSLKHGVPTSSLRTKF